MFDELRVRVSKNKFATLTSDEANLVFEALDAAVVGLRELSNWDVPEYAVDAPISYEMITHTDRVIDKIGFISRRPLSQERKKES